MTLLFLLLFWHALADFPLQGEWLAKYKARTITVDTYNGWKASSNPVWLWALSAHSMIHAGGVALITNNVWLGVAEFFTHACIDHLKCRNKLNFTQDQLAHIGCKVVYVIWLLV
jgi:hypothetical protein